MDRKQKIIVSITGIFLVLMILVGLTYAYFLTKITGNTNTKSISVTTANLVLEYGENTNVVQGISNAEPGYSVEKIFTATNKGNSTVTYGAALESIVNELSRQDDLVYTLTCTSYLKNGFSLASDGTISGTIDGTCNGVSTEKQFPGTSSLSIMTTNTIDTTHTQAYKLTVTYKEMGVDQSEDMNKTFSTKVNIVDLRANADKINPYSTNKNALNYQIINSALEGGTNRTIYGSEVTTFDSPIKSWSTGKYELQPISEAALSMKNAGAWLYADTEEEANDCSNEDNEAQNMTCSSLKGKYICDRSGTLDPRVVKIVDCNGEDFMINNEILGYERNLNTAPDDYGISYYYRGNVVDNYVSFADKTWRIVRINGDGSIRLVLDELAKDTSGNVIKTSFNSKDTDNAYVGYMYGTVSSSTYEDTHKNINSSDIKKTIDTWYENNLKTKYADFLADTLYCGNKGLTVGTGVGTSSSTYNQASYKKPTFECDKNNPYNYSRYTSKMETSTKTSKNVEINNDLTYPIGLLSLDEIYFTGYFGEENDYSKLNKTSYLYSLNMVNGYWIMSSIAFGGIAVNYYIYVSSSNTNSDSASVTSKYGIRPVINLKSSVLISGGNGTKENPYTVKLS